MTRGVATGPAANHGIAGTGDILICGGKSGARIDAEGLLLDLLLDLPRCCPSKNDRKAQVSG